MKSTFNTILLCLLFITTTCSNSPKYPKSAAEEGANIALSRLGDVSGMTLWENKVSFHESSLLRENVKYLYFSADKYKEVLAQSYNGKAENYNKITGIPNGTFINFDHEVVAQITEEGSLNIYTNFILYNKSEIEIKNLDGFTKIYAFTPIKEQYKINTKDNGSGSWETKFDIFTRYYLIKETDNTLLMIGLDKSTLPNIFTFEYNSLEESVQNISPSSVYTK